MKRLHLFLIKIFTTQLIVTFFIAIFILLMQFLWKYIDDLVGKGLEFAQIAELLFYASARFVPVALPIAILLSSVNYTPRSNTQHMIILVLPKKEVDVTYLKTLISDFHAKKTGNEVFEISALLLGLDNHLLMIKTFKNIKQSMEYYDLFIKETTLMSRLNKSKHKIMSISTENFQEFYKNKDVEGYYNFFKNNYLDKD